MKRNYFEMVRGLALGLAMVCGIGAYLGFAEQASADLIASWNLDGTPSNAATVSPNFSATNVEGSPMLRGSGLSALNIGLDSFYSRGWEENDFAPDSLNYVEWGFDVADGFQVDLDQLFFQLTRNNAGPNPMGLYTSLDAYSSLVVEVSVPSSGPASNFALDLSGLPSITGSFRIRLYEVGTNASSLNGNLTIWEYGYNSSLGAGSGSDVQFTGTVSQVVPEPASLALLLVGSIVAARFRRRST